MSYRIKLPIFEGPLDLLLFLIRKEEVDIYDIPIAKITKEYLQYIELMRELDLDVASEFIYMASQLMRIKVQMMLPKTPTGTEEEIEDPRSDLVRSLLEYQRYKEASEQLGDMERLFQKRFKRRFVHVEGLSEEDLENYVEVSLFDLMEALKKVLDTMPKRRYYDIRREAYTVEERIKFVHSLLKERGKMLFTDLLGHDRERSVIIVTFLAVLEMSKLKRLVLYQYRPFHEIWVARPDAAYTIAGPEEETAPETDTPAQAATPAEGRETPAEDLPETGAHTGGEADSETERMQPGPGAGDDSDGDGGPDENTLTNTHL